MSYNFYEVVLLIILTISLVVKIPLSFINKGVMLLVLFIIITPVDVTDLVQLN